LADPPAAGAARPAGDPGRFGVGRVESPRGETVCAVEIGGGTVQRLHLRTGSYANWPSVARAAEGGIVPDFPLVNKSFELCYACTDR
ncbi:MAG: NADH-quinone oxidoreductase subunit F, partial [Actinomycetota bacterium]